MKSDLRSRMGAAMAKTTVVIPNYNGIQYIEECLRSLFMQTYQDFAIIVVDNGSTDWSKEKVLTDFPKAKLIDLKENTGFCHAVNVGIEAAKTPYVLLLNNDTKVKDGFVLALEHAMESHQDAAAVAAKMVTMEDETILDGAGDYYCALGWAFALGKGKKADRFTRERKIFSACGGAVLYRKIVLEKIGYFDENHFAYLEDLDLSYRGRIHGYQNYYCPQAVVKHAGSGFSGSKYNEFKVNLSSKNSIYVIYKNMPLLQILLNLPLLILGFLVKIVFFAIKGLGKFYIRGLFKGIAFCFTKEARNHKVPFRFQNLPAYCHIQLELWVNIFIRFFGNNGNRPL